MRKGTIVLLTILLLALAGVASAAFPETIALPDNFRPEGVVMGTGTEIYAGSLANGAIYRADVRTGAGEILVPGAEGRVSVGMDFDERDGLLYVAGGPTGNAYVYNTRTGTMAGEYALSSGGPTFVNDVAVTEYAAYFTESTAPVLYRLDLASGAVTTIALAPPYPQVAGFNSNGIVATPGEEWLVLAHSATGTLHRVDPETGASAMIDLGGVDLPNADGLERVGNHVYVVQNRSNQISELKMAGDYLSGERVEIITDLDFDVPTTATKFGNALYAVNARFGVPGAVEYDIVRVER